MKELSIEEKAQRYNGNYKTYTELINRLEDVKNAIKEQIIAKAKSGTVQKDNQAVLDNGTYIDLDPSMQLKPSFVGLKEGDRIKVIIIKED